MFVDTPGSIMPVINDALQAADLILLPTQPSHLDLHGQDAVAARIEKLGLEDRMMFVLTRTSNKPDIEKAKAYLKPRTRHPILTIAERADYKRAAESGQAAWELSNNKDAKSEIAKLWDAMQMAIRSITTEKEGARDERRTRH
jgi:chromosome partitioning protein